MYSTLSKNIRYLRKKRRMSQANLAELLNRSESAIQMWETDLRSPTMEMVLKISELFNVDINSLVYIDLENDNNNNNKQMKVIPNISTVDEAMLFLLSNPTVSAYGGYDFDRMSDEEKIQFANKVAGMFKVISEEYKNK